MLRRELGHVVQKGVQPQDGARQAAQPGEIQRIAVQPGRHLAALEQRGHVVPDAGGKIAQPRRAGGACPRSARSRFPAGSRARSPSRDRRAAGTCPPRAGCRSARSRSASRSMFAASSACFLRRVDSVPRTALASPLTPPGARWGRVSMHGRQRTRSTCSSRRWLPTSKVAIESTSSSQNSTR